MLIGIVTDQQESPHGPLLSSEHIKREVLFSTRENPYSAAPIPATSSANLVHVGWHRSGVHNAFVSKPGTTAVTEAQE